MSISQPPLPIFSDYLEMGCLVVMFLIGAPLNLAAYTQLSERPVSSRLDLLKKHLNFSDLLIIFIYVPSRTCWLLTYDWRGGNALCKMVKFMHSMAFQSSSNVVVCIAIDRLLSVLSPNHNCPTRGKRRTKVMISIAWFSAVLLSIPQLFVWRDYLAIPSAQWSQCLTIWEVSRLQNVSLGDSFEELEKFYSIAHILFVFWLPTVIIIISYIIVLTWVWMNSHPVIGVGQNSTQTGSDTVDTVLSRGTNMPHNTRSLFRNWNPLRTFSLPKSKDDKPMPAPPCIIISDESSELINTRPSITPSEASAVIRSNVHTAQSYHANINRARALRVSFMLVSAYVICWLPYNLLSLIHIIESEWFSNTFSQYYFLHQLMVFNAVLNPYLYGLFGCPRKPNIRRTNQ